MAAFRKRSKSCPFLSQEFFIQNHADIVSCLVVLVLIGLMFEVTAKTAFMFISPQNNVSTVTPDGEVVYYLYGTSDFVTILFYICITIILHAVVQEYALDKLNKRLHLSKIKHSKLNESGQLIVLHLTSGIWGFYIAVTEGYVTNPNSLWDKYPHTELSFQVKFFFLCQLSYWIHSLPELYFQRVRKEEIPRQLQYIGLYLLHIAGAYLLNLTRLGVLLLVLQSVAELVFHTARLFYFIHENNQRFFNAWAVVFVMTRLMTLTLTVLVVGFGLSRVEHQTFDMERGIFNSLPIRLCILVTVCSTQAWMMWRFINFQLRRWREFQAEQASRRKIVGAMAMRGRVVRRELGHHENGLIKSENGTSPRTRKSKSP
ncbi:translocating chain-associated membrane protein 2 isoform X1 [Stegostoma tigrinum]|uniref:translocating chain-associated membrane protein 2 isoform X1 n=1 Tax=Stegostoma tigrinum TaxID=3053191 RepID=UPI00202B5F5A|nr:translocating chain-associated membrane protein 2 isoform X1 [Stegostoma tigrinum]